MSRQPPVEQRQLHSKIVTADVLMKKDSNTLINVTSYRVIYGDTDQMGVVYYANYLRWFERGRSELLRQIGVAYQAIERQGFHFPVAEVTCRYLQPARYDDVITIGTELVSVRRTILLFDYKISRETDQAVLAVGATKHACVDRAGRLVRIPPLLANALAAARP